MQVYSETIAHFLQNAHQWAKEILSSECHLKVGQKRFTVAHTTYPLNIICFEGKDRLAYFEPNFFRIGLNTSLITNAKPSVIKDILRHEIAHYFTHITYGDKIKPHGEEFIHTCHHFGFDSKIQDPQMNVALANDFYEGDLENEKILERIKNLLALGQSNNPYEAQLATAKANQLMIKHNISQFSDKNHEKLYVDHVYTAKRKNQKISCLYEILSHFLVRPLLFYGHQEIRLQVTGSKENIELAHYLAQTLSHKLDELWLANKNKYSLKGLKAKNSFYQGVAKGFNERITEGKEQMPLFEKNQLARLERSLDQDIKKIFGRLSYSKSSSTIDTYSQSIGRRVGKGLTINQALKKKTGGLLEWIR